MFLVNNEETIFHFRLELVEALIRKGYSVFISVPTGKYQQEIEKTGAKEINIEMDQHGTNPIKDLALLFRYKKLVASMRPDVVLTYTVKPNVYGGFACARLHVPCIGTITGLGKAFEDKGLIKQITTELYRIGLKKDKIVFFQNSTQKELFQVKGIIGENARLVPGSGVNLDIHKYEEYPHNEIIKFIFIGDVIRDKGIFELMEAYQQLKKKYNVSLKVVGSQFEEYPISKWANVDGVSFLGRRHDIHELLSGSDALVLPSYHEGTANVILEASGCGRPVIATDIPGCKEPIDDGKTGFLVPAKNAIALYEAMERMITIGRDKRELLGKNACDKVTREYDRKFVIDSYIKAIDESSNLDN